MHVYIAQSHAEVLYLEVEPTYSISDIKALIEVQTEVPMTQQLLVLEAVVLDDEQTVASAGIQNEDILQLVRTDNPVRMEALNLIQQFKANPTRANYFDHVNPPLANAIRTCSIDEVEEVLQAAREAHQQRRQPQHFVDEFDIEAQRNIEATIQQHNIDENLHYAQEYTPEVFATVCMLYIECEVNKTKLQAFVDSGAESTIMSKECAQKAGIMRLVDTRFHGQARGVGVGKILGRVHAASICVGGVFLNCSFHVMENMDIDLLFGLDMLKRHQCMIDLKHNQLHLHGGDIKIDFLSEGQITRVRGGKKSPEHGSPLHPSQSPAPQPVQPSQVPAASPQYPAASPQVPVASPQHSVGSPHHPAASPLHDSAVPVNEEAVTRLIHFGFPREAVIKALKQAGGDETVAGNLLFQMEYNDEL